MERKKVGIFIFIFIAFIVLGVGYAAINSINLIINGTGSITATQENFIVKFLDVDGHRPHVIPGSPNTVNVIDDITASFDVSTLSKKGDTATATIDAKNESNGVGARIGLNLTNSNTTYFKVTEYIADTELQAGDITTVTITIEMIKTPIDYDETTNITATLTANPIENSSATGSNSSEEAVPASWKIPVGRTATTLQAGDELQLKDQSFYFIRYDENNNLVLLAKYNLKVGENFVLDNGWVKVGQYTSEDSGYGLQSSETKGYSVSASESNGAVTFSATNYWVNKVSYNNYNLKSPYNENNKIYYNNTNYPHFRYRSNDSEAYPAVYDTNYITEPDFSSTCDNSTNCWKTEGYSIAYYVEKYRSILEGASYGAIIEDARLLQMPEVISFNGGSRNNVPKSSILRETSFWLGSACSDNSIWIVDAQYQLVDINYLNTVFCGVRPVLVISPSNI